MEAKSALMRMVVAILGFIALSVGSVSAGWNVEYVGTTNGWMGDNCSIAVDAQGRPHIAYAGGIHDLYYACKTGATWTVQLVKTNCNPRDRASINIDTNGRPHIRFGGYFDTPQIWWGVFHAYSPSGTNWSFETIDNSSGEGYGLDSIFDSTGRLHVSYASGDGLGYAVKSGGAWTVSLVTNYPSGGTSIAVDSQGNPHISYIADGMWYAAKTNSQWSLVRVDTNSATGNSSIAIGSNGLPHISWLDAWNNRVKYATWNGSSWLKESINNAVVVNELALKPDGTPVVAYQDPTYPGRLLISERTGGTWQTPQVVDTSFNPDYLDIIFLGMTLDKSLNPHMAYCNNLMGFPHQLKYACRIGVPSAPTGVSASDGTYSDRIQISWTASAGATGYEVWRNTNNVSGSATKIGQNLAGSPYDDLTVPQAITNYYWVKATNASGTSAFSASDSGLRASTSFTISGTVSYGGSQTGMVQDMASPYFVGQSNIALSLDGVDDAMVVTNPTAVLRLTNTHSFCAWINLGAMPAGTQATILMKYNGTNNASYVASIEKSTGRLRYSIGDSGTAYSTSTISTASGWTHITFTHDGGVGRWYVNGALDSSLTFASLQRWGDGPFYIGRAIDPQTYFDRFGGGIDEVSLWNRTLNQGEIQALMTNTLTGSETGLAGYWNFDDETGVDLTANANDGQFIYGATTTVRQAVGLARSTTLASPDGYSITNVPAGVYTIWAYRDSSGNGSNDPWEVRGHYLANPLSVTGAMGSIDIALHDPMADEDLDGLSDYDEVYVYGSLWNNPDSDDDGMSDGDEALAGSSPTNDESMFGFADSQPVPEGGGVVVSWPSLSNRIYRLERSTNLLLDFEPLVNDLPAHPPVNSYTDETPNVLGAYKVGVRME